ncbi:MAG: hypothetical protein ACKVT0_08925 [Planctomycetaceae bacterium]
MRWLVLFVLCAVTSSPRLWSQEASEDKGLISRWRLTKDARDSGPAGNHGLEQLVDFGDDGAHFGGGTEKIDVADDPTLALGTRDFSLSLHVHTDAELAHPLGDLLHKYDPETRRGFSLSIKHHAGVTGSQANYRNLHFGIDQGRQDAEWKDEGRPGNAIFVHSMAVHDGSLYVGTVDGWTNKDPGHVYQYDGNGGWKDLGTPW